MLNFLSNLLCLMKPFTLGKDQGYSPSLFITFIALLLKIIFSLGNMNFYLESKNV